MSKPFTLGRGLGSLIPDRSSEPAVSAAAKTKIDTTQEQVLKIPPDKISVNPHQPRTEFAEDSLSELKSSIKEHGILQPLIATQAKADTYELIAGERRLRCAQALNLEKVPVIVRKASDQQKFELALIENIQRQNLNPIEQAQAYIKLQDEFNLTQEQTAKRVGKSRSGIANSLRYLSLPQKIQDALAQNKITEGHAKLILSLASQAEQLALFKRIISHKLTVRGTEEEVKTTRVRPHQRRIADPNLKALEKKFEEALGTKVRIEKRGDKGKIMIEFYGEDDLQRMVSFIAKA